MTADPATAASARADSAWQYLDDLVDEIAGLAESRLAPREFWRRLLDHTVRALAAIGGAVWLRDQNGRLQLQYQIKHQAASMGADAQQRHQRLLAHVAETGLALSLPPHSGSASDPASDNPSDLLLLLSPVVSEGVTMAVVEILQRPSDLPTTPEGYLRFLSAVSELAADYYRHRQLGELRERTAPGLSSSSSLSRFTPASTSSAWPIQSQTMAGD